MSSANVGQLDIGLRFDAKTLNSSIKSTEKAMGDLSDTMSLKWQAAAGIVQNVAVKAFDTVASGITNLAKSVVQTGQQFESAMSNVAAISGATGEELNALTSKAQEMGATTVWSASDAADAMSYMAMAGWKTQDMLEGISGVMNLATAAGADLATTSDIVTDALTAFGLSAADSGRLADVMAAASSNANTNVELLGETFKYVAPVAGAMGYSIEDTAQAIGLMANAGIKGSQAGTSLRTVLQRLATDTGGAQLALENLGVTVVDADGSMRPLGRVISDMRVAFASLNQEEQVNVAKTVAGAEAMSGLLAIVNASDEDFNKLSLAIGNSSGTAEEMAIIMGDNLDGKIKSLQSKIESLQINAFNALEPAINAVVDALIWCADNADTLIPILGTLGGIMASVFVVNKIKSAASTVKDLFGGVTSVIGKFTSKSMEAAESFSNSSKTIGNDGASLGARLSDVINNIGSVIITVFDNLGAILNSVIGAVMEPIKTLLSGIGQAIAGFFETLANPAILVGIGVFTAAAAGIAAAIFLIGEAIGAITPGLADFLNSVLIPLGTFMAATLITVLNQVTDCIIRLTNEAIIPWGEFVRDTLVGVINTITDAVIRLTNEGLIPMGEFVRDTIIGVINTLTDSIVCLTNEALIPLIDKVMEFGDWLIEKVEKVVNFIKKTLQEIFNWIDEHIITPVKKLFEDLWTDIQNGVEEIKKIPGKMLDIGKDIVKGLWDGISGMVGWIGEKIGEFCGGIVDNIKSFFGIQSPSTLMRDEVGIYMAQGLGVGFTEEMAAVGSEMQDSLANNLPSGTSEADVAVSADMSMTGQMFTTEEQRLAYLEAMTLFYEQLTTKQTETLTNLTTNVDNWVTQTQNKVQQFTANIIQKITQFGQQAAQKAQEIGKNFHDKLLEQPNKLPDEFYQLGVGCIKGMEAGMRAQEPALMAYVDSLCSRIVAKIKAAMQIHSPSRVMRDEVGVFLTQGIGVGFSEEMEKVNSEMADSIVLPSLPGDDIASWSGAVVRLMTDDDGAGTGGGDSVTITQYNEINNEFDFDQVNEALLEQIRSIA